MHARLANCVYLCNKTGDGYGAKTIIRFWFELIHETGALTVWFFSEGLYSVLHGWAYCCFSELKGLL